MPILTNPPITGKPSTQLNGYTVATLPTGLVGDRAYVTDALAPVLLAGLVGGGSVVTPVFKNASVWVVG